MVRRLFSLDIGKNWAVVLAAFLALAAWGAVLVQRAVLSGHGAARSDSHSPSLHRLPNVDVKPLSGLV